MPRGKKTDGGSSAGELRKFTIETPKGARKAVCKLSLPLSSLNDIVDNLNTLVAEAQKEFPDASEVRGTITVYQRGE